MEKQYTVKCLSLGGPGNKVFKKNDVVSQKNFPGAKMDDLVKGGFLTAVEESESNETSLLGNIQKSLLETETPIKTIDEFKTNDLKKELTAAKIEFTKDATKEDLYNLWLNIKK